MRYNRKDGIEDMKQMKKTTKLLIALALISMLAPAVLLSGCGKSSEDSTEYIGIISAMDNEIEVLLEEAEIDRVDKVANVEYHVGTLRGKPVVITKAGIGKVRASSGVTAMLNNYNISNILFTGIAGGVADDTKVLDEIIATRLVEHDYGIITDEGFEWGSGDPGAGLKKGEYYECDPKLVEIAYEAAVKVVGKENAHKGTIASGDQFIASEKYVERLKKEYDAYACEMEGASVAVICLNYEKPFVVIRCLSDKADGKANDSYDNFGDKAGANSSRIIMEMLDLMD